MTKAINYLALIVCLLMLTLFMVFQFKSVRLSGTYSLTSLSTEVETYFDRYGIPHIIAKNDLDAYTSLGFLTASERLFQMDLLRRLIHGSLSEVFGSKTVQADIMLRKLRLQKTAQEYLLKSSHRLNPVILKQIDAYLKGVNEFIDRDNLPVEFTLLGYTPKHFEPADVLGLTYYMAMTFAEGLHGDIFMSEMIDKLPPSKMEIIRVGDKVDYDYFLDQKLVKNTFIKKIKKALFQIEQYLPIFHGSNSWVLAPSRTKSKMAILANDPHIGAGNPHIFYEAHLKYPSLEVYGHFIPLNPFPVIGHTDYSAWGITISEIDDLTIYSEKFNPENPDEVMYKNEWVSVKRSTEIIKVKDAEDLIIETVLTPHGPLLDGSSLGKEGKNLSLNWSVYHSENDVLQTFYDLPLARTVSEFKEALKHAAAPGLNISWVNKQGDIAWWTMGKFPILPVGINYDLVLDGSNGQNEIIGYYSFEENPHDVNPKNGVIITANYRPQYSQFRHFEGYWQPGGRYFRIEKLLKEKTRWSLEDLKKIQVDNLIPEYKILKHQLVLGVDASKLNKYELEVLIAFKKWKGRTDIGDIGASIFHMFNYQVTRNVFIDEFGEDGFKTYAKTDDFWHAYKKLILNQDHSFWDNIKTDHVENGKEVITLSFKEAVSKLKDRLGGRIDKWSWGRLHKALYIHPLGRVKALSYIYNIGPYPAAGARYAINNLAHDKATDNFNVIHAPATRRLIDMSNPRESLGVLPTGNSGNPFSEFFSDQLKLYHSGKYRLQDMNWERIKKRPLLLLKPSI